jgi:hypothetical protein
MSTRPTIALVSDDWVRPVVHFEITARNPTTLIPFYEAMFNWPVDEEGALRNFPAGLGGPEPGPAGHFREGTPGIQLYIQVRDLDVSLAQAVELGGQVTLGRFDIPNGPTIAAITDPEGNGIGLVQQ